MNRRIPNGTYGGVLDDIKTIFNPNASMTDKGLAIVSLFPAGKVVKSGKLFELLKKYGKGEAVDAFAGLGKVLKYNSKGILLEGNSQKGWQHIVNNHVVGKSGKTIFPNIGEANIKNLVMDSVAKGRLITSHSDGTKVYSYDPGKYGISGMETVVDKNNVIITSYPTKGTAVKRKL